MLYLVIIVGSRACDRLADRNAARAMSHRFPGLASVREAAHQAPHSA
jgi:hypothetical protein